MNINDFNEITSDTILSYKNVTKNLYNNSESSVASMFTWQHYYNVTYNIFDNIIYTFMRDENNNYASFMPYGASRNTKKTIDTLVDFHSKFTNNFKINLCTIDFVSFVKELNIYKFNVVEKRNSFDYIYNTSDLINLSGKKYHSKKNHINSFRKLYSYDYVKYDSSMKNECLNFCKKVLKDHYTANSKNIDVEMFSIQKAFDNMDILNLKAGLILVNDNIVALSVGEKLNNDYALIHIEKADYNYRTAYSVINNLFLKNEFSETKYVNREEDMGIEGIRKAKLSYKPCFFIPKYTLEFYI